MRDGRIIIAWLSHRYRGHVCFGAPIILGLDPQRYQTICVHLMKNSEKPNFFEEKGYRVFYISSKKSLRMFNLWVIWKLSRVLKREKVDILHCHRHQATIYGTIAAKLAGVPVVFSHVHGLKRTRNLRRKVVNWVILRWVTKIVTVSKAVKEDVLRDNPVVRPEQVIFLTNSIDYDQFANVRIPKEQAKQDIGLNVNSFVFGTVGRLTPTKGQIYLIRAFAKVKQELPTAELVLAGDGWLREQLSTEVKTNLNNFVHFLGQRTDVPQILKAMDVFVFPSIAEGMPFAILEAMAAGVPCIASAVGGIPEIITHNETGFLVPSKDEKALADAMIAVAKKPEQEIAEIVNKAKELVRTSYTHEEVRKKLEHLYETELQSSLDAKL